MEDSSPVRHIVKIQLPLVTNEKVPMALVYNEDRSFEMMLKMSDIDLIVRHCFDGKMKQYFLVQVTGDEMSIHDVAPWQDW